MLANIRFGAFSQKQSNAFYSNPVANKDELSPYFLSKSSELILNSNDATQAVGAPILRDYIHQLFQSKEPVFLARQQEGHRITQPRTCAQWVEQMVHLMHRVAHVNIPTQLMGSRLTLNEALRKDHPFLVHALLKRLSGNTGLEALSKKDQFGLTALHTAVLTRHLPEAKQILQKGADPFALDQAGRRALDPLVEMGEESKLSRLIGAMNTQEGLVNQQRLHTLLSEAKENQASILRFTGEYQSLNTKQRQLALFTIAASPYNPIFEMQMMHRALALLNLGASLDAKNEFGNAPIHCAAQKGHSKLVLAFLQKGAKVNSRDAHGNSILLDAVCAQKAEVVDLLLQCGADVNLANQQGNTPLIIGAYLCASSMIERLLTAGADVHFFNKNKETALHLAAQSEAGLSAVVKLLLEHGANPNAKDVNGTTPLDRAIVNSHDNLVSILKGAEGNRKILAG